MPSVSNNTTPGRDDVANTTTGSRVVRENAPGLSVSTPYAVGRELATALISANSLLRSGVRQVLSGTPFKVIVEGPEADPRLVGRRRGQPSLVILAANQLSNHTPDTVRQIKERHPAARVVLLADHFDLETVTQGRESGVDGFCLTGSSPDVLITSLELVMLGEVMLPGSLVRSILDNKPLSPRPEPARKVLAAPESPDPGVRSLSAREAEILGCLMDGTSNKMIARRLHVTEATVKVHIKAILRKIGVANRTQAAIWATEHLPLRLGTSRHD